MFCRLLGFEIAIGFLEHAIANVFLVIGGHCRQRTKERRLYNAAKVVQPIAALISS